MSSAASWSYTSKATAWAFLGRDDWTGLVTYGSPSVFACDYSADNIRLVDRSGVEFTTRQTIYTERSDLKQGDMVLIGESTEASPIEAGAFEIRMITRDADVFERIADDFKVFT